MDCVTLISDGCSFDHSKRTHRLREIANSLTSSPHLDLVRPDNSSLGPGIDTRNRCRLYQLCTDHQGPYAARRSIGSGNHEHRKLLYAFVVDSRFHGGDT